MISLKAMTTTAMLGAALLAAAPAAAVMTSFASLTFATGDGIVWKSNGGGGSTTSWEGGGTGGSLYTTSAGASVRADLTGPGSILTKFSYLDPLLAPYFSNIDAVFTLTATTIMTPAIKASGGYVYQGNLSGSFAITPLSPFLAGTVAISAGANLLSGTFNGLHIGGFNGQTSALFGGTTLNSTTISFTSDYLDFSGTSDRDMSLALNGLLSRANALNAGLNAATGKALRSFRSGVNGNFSSDAAALVDTNLASALRLGQGAVPEPQVWAMLVIGFGAVGVQIRRRRRTVAC